MTQPGTRVVAIRDADQDEVRVFGRGTYVGDHPRPGADRHSGADRAMAESVIRDGDAHPLDTTGMAAWYVEYGNMTPDEAEAAVAASHRRHEADVARPIAERATELLDRMALNPRIDLDDGGTVWGFQCWWGSEDRFEQRAAGRRVVEVPLPDAARTAAAVGAETAGETGGGE